jgi:hypothetical protein
VLRRRGDDSKLPFDVSHYTYLEYEPHAADELYVWSPADNTSIPFDEVLVPFLDKLPRPFWSAERWEPESGERTGRFVSESSAAEPAAP